MASVAPIKLLNETLTGPGPHFGGQKSSEPKQTSFIVVGTTANATGNTDIIIEHSPDGQNWHTWATLPQIAGNGQEVLAVSASLLPQLRARVALSAGPVDVDVKVFYDRP